MLKLSVSLSSHLSVGNTAVLWSATMPADYAIPPLPQPTLFWETSDSNIPQGLYVSPNSTVFPDHRKGPFNGSHRRFPDPWRWYYPSVVSGPGLEGYWTCLLPKNQTFDGIFHPLSSIDVISEQVANGREKWKLSSEAVSDWRRLEDLIVRCFKVVSSMVPWELSVGAGRDKIPLPSYYNFLQVFDSKGLAMSHSRKIRAVFMMWMVKLQFLGFFSSEDKDSWINLAYDQRVITLEEKNDIMTSMLCSRSVAGGSMRRIGLILDARETLFSDMRERLLKLLKNFKMPLWVYYGTELDVLTRIEPLAKEYLPDSDAIQRVQQVYADKGVKTLPRMLPSPPDPSPSPSSQQRAISFTWYNTPEDVFSPAHNFPSSRATSTSSSSQQHDMHFTWSNTPEDVLPPSHNFPSSREPAPSTSSQKHDMRFTWDNTPEDVLPPTHNVATTPENPVTGLRPGETYREFFARMDASINHSFANGTPEQIQRWTARRIKHSALELPTREGNPLVFFWEDEEVRKLIGRKHWRNTFEDSGKSQRRYNPVLDQWDVCPFLDPGYRPDDSNEEYYDEHWPSQGHVFEIEKSTGVDTGSGSNGTHSSYSYSTTPHPGVRLHPAVTSSSDFQHPPSVSPSSVLYPPLPLRTTRKTKRPTSDEDNHGDRYEARRRVCSDDRTRRDCGGRRATNEDQDRRRGRVGDISYGRRERWTQREGPSNHTH